MLLENVLFQATAARLMITELSWVPPIGCPETSLRNYHQSLRNNPEERSSLLTNLKLETLLWIVLSSSNFSAPGEQPRILTSLLTCYVQRTGMENEKSVSRSWFQIATNTQCRSQWPRGLRRRPTAARLLRLCVRIPPEAWMFVVSVVCCQVEVTATDWSLVQMSATNCRESLCVIKKPRKWGG